jgi:hypothetical protein
MLVVMGKETRRWFSQEGGREESVGSKSTPEGSTERPLRGGGAGAEEPPSKKRFNARDTSPSVAERSSSHVAIGRPVMSTRVWADIERE